MVRSTVPAPSVVSRFEALPLEEEWGLLLGQSVGERDYVLCAVPQLEGCDGPEDTAWAAAHASQVARMLVGGTRVLGAYAYCAEEGAAARLALLCAIAEAARAELRDERAAWGLAPSEAGGGAEWLVLHVSYGARRYTCKSLGGDGAAPRPTEWKPSKEALRFRGLRCTLPLRLRLGSSATIDAAREAALGQLPPLAGAQAVVHGALLDRAQPISQLGSAAGAEQVVEFLCPNLGQPTATASASGVSLLHGDVCGRVCVHDSTSAAEALDLLALDVRVALLLRFEIQREAGSSAARAAPTDLLLPRRVFVHGGDADCFCDYTEAGEGAPAIASRADELLGIAVDEGGVEQAEAAAEAGSLNAADVSVGQTGGSSTLSVANAVAAAVFAVALIGLEAGGVIDLI